MMTLQAFFVQSTPAVLEGFSPSPPVKLHPLDRGTGTISHSQAVVPKAYLLRSYSIPLLTTV